MEVWCTNSTLEHNSAILELSFIDFQSGWEHRETRNVLLEPNQTTEIISMQVPEPPLSSDSEFADLEPKRTMTHTVVISARLLDRETKRVLSRIADWPQSYRFIDFPDPGLNVRVVDEIITVSAERPVKGLIFSIAEEADVKWSDNGIDVIPGDPQEIIAEGIGNRRLRLAYMGGEKTKEVQAV